MNEEPIRRLMLIGGTLYDSDQSIAVSNPAKPSETVGYVPKASKELAVFAIKAAKEAFPGWSSLQMEERLAYLRLAVANIERVAAHAAHLLTREQGKVLSESKVEVQHCSHLLEKVAKIAVEMKSDSWTVTERGSVSLGFRSRGVMTGIIPWNWPILLMIHKVFPALLTGNTIVLKPSSAVPLTVLWMVEEMGKSLPPGVINVVSGSVSEIGDVLITHPDVSSVSFTGSTEAGRDVYMKAARQLKRVSLELGGNDAAIVLEDASLDSKAIIRMLQGTFSTSGQGCQLIKRVYVHRSRYEELLDKLVSQANAYYLVGNGLHSEAKMGPLTTKDQLAWVKELKDDAVSRGAKILETGTIIDSSEHADGYFHLPTFVTNVDDSFRVSACEQFGPLLPIMPFDSTEEAIARSNDSEFGLCASIWTSDDERAFRIAKSLEVGTVLINSHNIFGLFGEFPYGGFKQSGIGRELGRAGLEEMTEIQVVSNRMK